MNFNWKFEDEREDTEGDEVFQLLDVEFSMKLELFSCQLKSSDLYSTL